MATVHPPPFALLPRPRADAEDDSDSESVAESCPCPHPRRAAASTHEPSASVSSSSCGGSACCHDEEGMDEDEDDGDDGCSSCVQGDECGSYQEEDYGESNKAASGVWWEQMAVAGGATAFPLMAPPARVQEPEDPKRAAERQEEDRKFWEDCLASGYP